MAEAAARYPLRRGRWRTRWHWRWRWRRRLPRADRIAAIATLLIAVAGAGLAIHWRHADPYQAYHDGVTAMAEGRFADARRLLRIAQEAMPGETALALARIAVEEEDGAAAATQLQRAAAAGVPALRLATLQAAATLLADDADTPDAPADPSPFGVRVRARIAAATGDARAAEGMLAALVAAAPREAGGWTDLGRLRFARGDLPGAEAAVRRALAIDGGAPAALTLEGDIAGSRYGPVAAIAWYAAALARDPDYLPALLPQAAALGETGRSGAALAALRRAIAIRPGARQPPYLLAVIAARAGRPALAHRLLQTTDEAADSVPGALFLNGWLAEADGHHDLAVAKWQQLLGDQPLDIGLRRITAVALLASGDAGATLDTLAPLVARGDADSETLELAARAARLQHDPRAAGLHDRAIGGGRGPSTAFASSDAVATLAMAAASAPSDPVAVVALIRGLITAGDTAAAVTRARTLAAAAPGAAPAQLALGDALMAAGRSGEAAQVYARAADLRFDTATMLRLVDGLARTGHGADAARTVELFLSQNPQSLVARRLAGHWLAAAGDLRATEVLEALRRDVGDRDAALLADLALAWRGGDLPRARIYAAAAYRLVPMNPAVVRLYADILAAAGDREGARQLRAKDKALAAGGR